MKLRNLIMYFAILVALVAWLYFWEIKHKSQEKAAKDEAEKIVHLAKDKVLEVDIQSEKNQKIIIKRLDKNWVVAAPVATKADESAIERLLTSAAGAKSERVILETDVTWEEYGLDKPELTVSLTTPEKRARLTFGSRNPAKTSYYLRRDDDPQLFLVADTLKNSLDKSLFELREKTVFGIAPEDVDSIAVTAKGADLRLERQGTDKWHMAKPQQIRVKSSLINKSLIDLTNLQAKAIIDEPKKEGDPYGLNQPEEVVTLSGKKIEQTLLIGKMAKDEEPAAGGRIRFARIKGREPVYEVNADVLAALKTDSEHLRDKSLVELKPADVEKIKIDLDGKKWIAVKNTDKEWKLESPKKSPLQAWEITSILWDLKGLEWNSINKTTSTTPGSLAIDNPKLVISLKLKDKKDPIILRAGWTSESEVSSEESQQAGSQEERKNIPSGDETTTRHKDAAGSKPKPEMPEMIQVQVEPHEEKNALFTVNSRFVERLRSGLEELGRTK